MHGTPYIRYTIDIVDFLSLFWSTPGKFPRDSLQANLPAWMRWLKQLTCCVLLFVCCCLWWGLRLLLVWWGGASGPSPPLSGVCCWSLCVWCVCCVVLLCCLFVVGSAAAPGVVGWGLWSLPPASWCAAAAPCVCGWGVVLVVVGCCCCFVRGFVLVGCALLFGVVGGGGVWLVWCVLFC
jgi:hypothetical protein